MEFEFIFRVVRLTSNYAVSTSLMFCNVYFAEASNLAANQEILLFGASKLHLKWAVVYLNMIIETLPGIDWLTDFEDSDREIRSN